MALFTLNPIFISWLYKAASDIKQRLTKQTEIPSRQIIVTWHARQNICYILWSFIKSAKEHMESLCKGMAGSLSDPPHSAGQINFWAALPS